MVANPELRHLLTGDQLNPQTKRIFDFFTILALCNTVLVADAPHKDLMNSSGTIDDIPEAISTDPAGGGHDKYTKFVSVKLSKFQNATSKLTNNKFPKMAKQKSMSSIASTRMSIFEAESPDELALVNAAFAYDFILINRTPSTCAVSFPNGVGLIHYDVLKVLPFDSSRKCMSIIVRRKGSNVIMMFTKGADSAILSQLKDVDVSQDEMHLRETVQHHLNLYARKGLRVLVMAKRELSAREFEEWHTQHQEIEMMSGNREKRLRDSFIELEQGLTLVGATGIEDKLQEKVPETISSLILAGKSPFFDLYYCPNIQFKKLHRNHNLGFDWR